MTFYLFLEQTLNAFQLGVMLFLMAAGLTLVFGIMNMINLAHGSFYMIGAYVAAYVQQHDWQFFHWRSRCPTRSRSRWYGR